MAAAQQRSRDWAFGLLALGPAATGIYAVMAQGVEQRRRELGVRLALGASRANIFRLVVGRAAILAVIGAAIGLAAAVPAMTPMRALLYEVPTGEPLLFAALAGLLIFVHPARRLHSGEPRVEVGSDRRSAGRMREGIGEAGHTASAIAIL